MCAKAVAKKNASITELPWVTVGLKELSWKARDNPLSPCRERTLGHLEKVECFGMLCLRTLLKDNILQRNRISSQIYGYPVGLLR